MDDFFRVIPTLLLSDNGLVKTINFKNKKYIGDPINVVRIFNEKEADELTILDVDASIKQADPDFNHIEEIVSEAFMPVGYGGGVTNILQIEKLFKLGVEKVIINSSLFKNPTLVKEAVNQFGAQSIVASIDVKKTLFQGYKVFTSSGTKKVNLDFNEIISKINDFGVGELFVNSIDKDGLMQGYDLDLFKKVNSKLKIPVMICGGAGSKEDLIDGIKAGASGVAAGSLFIYQGIHKAVLISYVKNEDILLDL